MTAIGILRFCMTSSSSLIRCFGHVRPYRCRDVQRPVLQRSIECEILTDLAQRSSVQFERVGAQASACISYEKKQSLIQEKAFFDNHNSAGVTSEIYGTHTNTDVVGAIKDALTAGASTTSIS